MFEYTRGNCNKNKGAKKKLFANRQKYFFMQILKRHKHVYGLHPSISFYLRGVEWKKRLTKNVFLPIFSCFLSSTVNEKKKKPKYCTSKNSSHYFLIDWLVMIVQKIFFRIIIGSCQEKKWVCMIDDDFFKFFKFLKTMKVKESNCDMNEFMWFVMHHR